MPYSICRLGKRPDPQDSLSRQGEGVEQGGWQSVLACLSWQKGSQVWKAEVVSPFFALYGAPLIDIEGNPSTSAWAWSMETCSLLPQRCCPGKDHYSVPAFVGNALSICSNQQIRVSCFNKKDYKRTVWLMCLSPGVEQAPDHDFSWTTATPPQPACKKSSQWRPCTLRKFRGIKGNNKTGCTGLTLLKGKRKQETELLLQRQPAMKEPRKDLVKLLAWIDISSYHYHPPLLCFMTHNSTSFALNQAHKCTQRWLALICSSPPARGWAEATATVSLGLGLMERAGRPWASWNHRHSRFWLLFSDVPLWWTWVRVKQEVPHSLTESESHYRLLRKI